MKPRCQECGRTLTNDASRALGIGPVCIERMRARGLVVGGTPRKVREPLIPRVRVIRWRVQAVPEAQLALEFA